MLDSKSIRGRHREVQDLAPASIAQVAKQQRSDRPHEKTGAEYAKRLDQRSDRIFRWKVIASDRNREET